MSNSELSNKVFITVASFIERTLNPNRRTGFIKQTRTILTNCSLKLSMRLIGVYPLCIMCVYLPRLLRCVSENHSELSSLATIYYEWPTVSGGARGHPDRGSSFPDRGGAEVSAGSTLPCSTPSPPPTSSHYIYCKVEAQLTSCMHISRN